MDLERIPSNGCGQKASLSITSALVLAVLEWILIFMLFIDASFSYLVTRFARYCKLQIPCLLCSRLDHVLGNERTGFYWDLICHNHKLNMSSLILCQLHNNLVDVHGTCESCFFSFATVNKSNAETYRLLVGKVGAEPYYGLTKGASSDEHNFGTRKCICCNEKWISSGSCTQELFQNKSVASNNTCSKYNRDDADPLLPHVEYKKIKISSDTESSEGPFADSEKVQDLLADNHVRQQIITVADNRAASPVKLSNLESEDMAFPCCNVECETPFRNGLEELNWQQADSNNDVNEPPQLISISELVPSPDINETHHDKLKEPSASLSKKLEHEVHVEHIEASNMESDSTGTVKLLKDVTMDCPETSRVESNPTRATDILIGSKHDNTDTGSQKNGSLDLGDAYKIALGARGRQLSGRLLEQQRSMKESMRASEDLKLLLSEISAARGIEFPLNDTMSPRVSANTEDFKAMVDASGAIGMQIFQRRVSLERNESNLSLDGSIISEIEGESLIDRLKRQVEHDKKLIGTLYKELEEERNASAIAANQAMAMITRLQEEKAALHMEALQYLRMMEEQAEYDGEALDKANQLLAERQKQIQDFEFELEMYRNQFGDVSFSDNSVNPPTVESDTGEQKERKSEAKSEASYTTPFHKSNHNNNSDIVNKIDRSPKVSLDNDSNIGRTSQQQLEEGKKNILHD